ncbi:ABC transporter permease [Rhizobium alvei]|uniref:ABC transporter permease n=1 Tax=Rhizobium alvei TaxID=1132659 RepID=A0ABT8YGX1_9HYPH|nr:ABC transporter permease [Rhizobium alvei]MDO6962864.1 ABC transporter permease [Rhizobium alvei]
MKDLLARYGAGLTFLMCALVLFWLLVLVIFPNLYLFENSFRPYLPVQEIGGPKDIYTLKNYMTFFESPIHISVFLWTVLYSSFTTAICFAIAYPLAFYLSKRASPRSVPTIFLLLTIPLWVSEIMRSFAWFIILSLKGPLNFTLLSLDLIEKPIRWMTGFRSVMIGLVYTYVLFMLFPIYNSIQSLDSSQIEAAEDLGAPGWRIHWRVILPHAKPGIASGSVMVFMLCAGSILVPTLLASTNSRWFTEIIQQWMFESLDWNTGAAYAFLLLILCTLFVTLVMRLFRVKLSDIAK